MAHPSIPGDVRLSGFVPAADAPAEPQGLAARYEAVERIHLALQGAHALAVAAGEGHLATRIESLVESARYALKLAGRQ